MTVRALLSTGDGRVESLATLPDSMDGDPGWLWVDVSLVDAPSDVLVPVADLLQLDALAVRDALLDDDHPKVDDFGHHLLVVLHGLRSDRVATYEVDCFLTHRALVTVHREPSQSVEALWTEVQRTPELSRGGPDELLARLADVLTRRLLSVLDAFDNRIDDLVVRALGADQQLLGEVTAVRSDLAAIRQIVHPQREALDRLRAITSRLVSDPGRRRFSDVFDVAARIANGIDAARSSLAETLEAYRGAEARQATEVTKVLTVYAAIMLPLSLVVGFFGMNFPNLPGTDSRRGWVVVVAAMLAVAAVSMGVFVALGWIQRPSVRQAATTLGRGLIEATRAPAQVVESAVATSLLPFRRTRPGPVEHD